MNWIPVVLGIAAFIGISAGIVLALQNKAILVGVFEEIWKALWPDIWKFISKRKTPEEEAQDRKDYRLGSKPPPPGTGVKTGKTIVKAASTHKH